MNPEIIAKRAAAKQAKLDAQTLAQLLGPRIIGGKYFCGYWSRVYTVIAIHAKDPSGFAGPSITVRWEAGDGRDEHMTTHSTRWDARCDRVFSPLKLEVA